MRYGLSAAALAAAALPGVATAQSTTGNVGSAGIDEGEQTVEWRIGADEDGYATRIHYDYAPTAWYQLRAIAGFSQPDGDDFDYDGFTFENWFLWSREADDNSGFNGGFRLTYGIGDGAGGDEVETRLTLTDKFGAGWEWRANFIAEAEAGEGSRGGIDLETRFQLTRALEGRFADARWRAGADLFSEYGNSTDFAGSLDEQAHQVGPVVKADWDSGVYLQASVRAGLTDASDDAMFKLFIGRDF